MTKFTLPGVPGEFQWHIPPLEWSFDQSRGLLIVAAAKTDWFSDPAGGYAADSAPCALTTPPDDNFLLSAKVSVDFASPFDAGVFQVRASEDLWAKLCFEYSPQGRPMVVSVVTQGLSDDCNSAEIDGTEVYLRVARTPDTLAFHYSHDGLTWRLVRYFTLGKISSLKLGFSAQSPMGTRCTAVFSRINYRGGRLKDIRNGE